MFAKVCVCAQALAGNSGCVACVQARYLKYSDDWDSVGWVGYSSKG